MTEPRAVVIVGGGIAGLATAFYLHEKAASAGLAIRCTLLEAAPSWGGKIVTHRIGNLISEAGPDSFLSQKPWALELCARLGLTDQLINTNETGKKAFVFSRGRMHELPEGLVTFSPSQVGPFLKSGLLSPVGLARMGLDLVLPARRSPEDESLASFFRRRLGREAFERLIEPLMAGIYAGDAEQMSLQATFPRFLELEREHGSVIRGMMAARRTAAERSGPKRTMFVTLKGGLGDLVGALVDRVSRDGTVLRAGAAVGSIRVRSHRLGRWMYDLVLEDGAALSAESVVLATPAYVAADLVRPLTPIAAGLLGGIPYASTATIALAYDGVAGNSVEGFGFVVPRAERRDLLAATWTSLKWPHRAPNDRLLVRCYVGGVGREGILTLSDDELLKTVREELAAMSGLTAVPQYAEVNRWPKAMPQYQLGHPARLAQIETALDRFQGLFITGAGYRGIGIPDCIRDAGLTADRIVRFLTVTEM